MSIPWLCLHSKAYRFLVIEPNSSIGVNTITESRDVVFYENRFTTIPRLEFNQKRNLFFYLMRKVVNHLVNLLNLEVVKGQGLQSLLVLILLFIL